MRIRTRLNFIVVLVAASLNIMSPDAFAAESYECQLTSSPGIFYRTVNWNGETPFQYPIEYNHRSGLFKVSSIGLRGHPDYLFEIQVEGRPLLAASQERHLKDYNLSWRSDDPSSHDALINVACRLKFAQ